MPALPILFSALILALPFLLLLLLHILYTRKNNTNLPPGSFGWPVLGESLALLGANRRGSPESFVHERMKKYGCPPVFKTSLMGERMVVFCTPGGNKFLFGNESKVVALWWPASVQKLVGRSLLSMTGEEARRARKILLSFLSPDALMRYIAVMNEVTLHHIKTQWEGKEEIKVYPTVKLYAFELACRLFTNIQEPELVTKLGSLFHVFLKGVIELPFNVPGTRFYKAMRAADAIRKELRIIIKERRSALQQNKASPSQDLLSHLLVNADENGKFMTETEVINNIITLLFAGHDTSSSAITLIIKYLAENPQVFENILKEQMHIAASKGPGESLKWEDIQNMRCSWAFISELLRLTSPVVGSFREALVDFTYEGYTIPKGWKLYWSAASTHKDTNIFPDPEQFDVSRFQGDGPAPFSYVPFGGGPRMCLGKEFARIQMLVFLHNIINMFRWKLQIPNEKIIYDPMPTPVHGLPLTLQPHNFALSAN